MACSCNCSPCSCSPAPVTCCTPTTESVEYTFENANLAGIGVFDNDTDNLVQFRGIVSDSAALTVSLDAGDNTIVLSFDENVLVGDLPDATTTQRGVLETATNAEAQAKAATDKILTPSNLAALAGSTSFVGLVELATIAEAQAGASSSVAVTPDGLAATIALSNTVTFADAVARAAATPAFQGQFGSQQDTNIPYMADGLAAGDWVPLIVCNMNNILPGDTQVDMNGFEFRFTNGLVLVSSAQFTMDGGTFVFTGAAVNFDAADFQINGTSVPVDRVIITAGGAGDLSSKLIADFVSNSNTQTGYTTFSNPATLRTCDTATVTLQQLAQIVGTLIEDLKAVRLPAT